jgi:dolichol-phosphate mannosyltransferase
MITTISLPLPEVSVTVPLHNEEDSVGPLIEAIESTLTTLGISWELIMVDDGSTDRSLERLCKQQKTRPWLRVLSLGENRGQSAALAMGIRAARGPVVVTLDADLQNDPRDIPKLLEALDEGYGVVSGVRVDRRDKWLRRVSSRVANRVRRACTGDELTDIGCALKAYQAEYLRGIPVFDGMHRFLPVLAQCNGARIKEVPVRHHRRQQGQSHYGVSNRLWSGLADLWSVRWLQRRWIADVPSEEFSGDRKTGSSHADRLESPWYEHKAD